jgi:protein phosphatase
MRVLGDVEEFPDVDTEVLETLPGDRWMLCSDGLSGPVPTDIMDRIMLSRIEADEATELLIGEALEFGAPDNVTVVVVDVVSASTKTDFVASPKFVGSSANDIVIDERKGRRFLKVLNPLNLPELIMRRTEDPADYMPESDELLEKILRETKSRILWRKIRQVATVLAIIAGIIWGLIAAYDYTQTRYYVGVSNGNVAIYKGIKEALGPFKFSTLYSETMLSVDSLNEYQRRLVERSISAESLEEATRILKQIQLAVPND